MMTRLQKAAMAWWNENDRPDKAHLHVVDVDDGSMETLSIEKGVVCSSQKQKGTAALASILGEMLPELDPSDEEMLIQVNKRNQEAAENNAALPDLEVIEKIENKLASWLDNAVSFFNEESGALILLVGKWADYYPLEAAVRRQYNQLDVFLDDPSILKMLPLNKTPRRSLPEMGEQLYSTGVLKAPFENNISLFLLNRQGLREKVLLAQRGRTEPEQGISFAATKQAEVTILCGNKTEMIRLNMVNEGLTVIKAAADNRERETVQFKGENGNILYTWEHESATEENDHG